MTSAIVVQALSMAPSYAVPCRPDVLGRPARRTRRILGPKPNHQNPNILEKAIIELGPNRKLFEEILLTVLKAWGNRVFTTTIGFYFLFCDNANPGSGTSVRTIYSSIKHLTWKNRT